MEDGGPAFPVVGMTQKGDQQFLGVFENGMSLRDWFAGQALPISIGAMPTDVARVAYIFADAMLAEREKGK